MSTTTAVSGQPVKNNNSTVMAAGTLSALKNVSLGNNKSTRNKVIAPTATSGTDLILDSGIFAYDATNSEVITLGATSKINGSANDVIRFTAADDSHRRNVHNITSVRTMHITSWNYATGVATKSANTTDSFGVDYEANINKNVPGYLVILETGKNATSKSY
jgi:hypothetical protein